MDEDEALDELRELARQGGIDTRFYLGRMLFGYDENKIFPNHDHKKAAGVVGFVSKLFKSDSSTKLRNKNNIDMAIHRICWTTLEAFRDRRLKISTFHEILITSSNDTEDPDVLCTRVRSILMRLSLNSKRPMGCLKL